MNRDKVYFAAGLLIGIVLSALFFFSFASRYTVAKTGDTLIRQDTWTGQSWRLVENDWKIIRGVHHDWGKIEEALTSALRLPFADVNTDSALKLLKEKYPILQELSDSELLEQIKIVYSRHVLSNLYLESFLKAQEGKQEGKR